MIAKLILWMYLIIVVPVVVVTMAGLIYGGFKEAVKYFNENPSAVR